MRKCLFMIGSLYSRLHEKDYVGRTPLDWEHRMEIALSAALGVAYLHEIGKLVHGNIKSSNILLQQEEGKHALVSDFGLNTLFGTYHHVSGYSAPEVLNEKILTSESDVYSFGILLLELLTGKAPKQASLGEDLPRWVHDNIQEEWDGNVVTDVELIRYPNIEVEMVQLLQIAIECVSTMPKQRPSMYEVVRKIRKLSKRNLMIQQMIFKRDHTVVHFSQMVDGNNQGNLATSRGSSNRGEENLMRKRNRFWFSSIKGATRKIFRHFVNPF